MRIPYLLTLTGLLVSGMLLCRAAGLAQTIKPALEQSGMALNAVHDARLAKALPLCVRSQRLDEVLQQLGQASGVTLRANAAWIGELRVDAFARALPLYRLLERLAQVHHLSWRLEMSATTDRPRSVSQNGDVPRYVLYESDTDRRYVAYLKRRSYDPFRRDLAQLRHYVTLSAQELERLAHDGDMVAAQLTDAQERACAMLKTTLPETSIDELIARPNRNLTLSYTQLPPESQEALSLVLQQRWEARLKSLRKAEESGTQIPAAAYIPSKAETYSVTYSLQGQGTWTGLTVMVTDKISMFSSNGTTTSYDPASIWLAEKRALTRSVVRPERRVEARRTPAAIALNTRYWLEAMEAAAAKWKLNLFSEGSRDGKAAALPISIPFHIAAKSPLVDGLGLMESWGGRWWQASEDGDDVIFQGGGWYMTRGSIIDNNLLARLKKARQQRGPFTLEIMADLADASEMTQQEAERHLDIEPVHLRQCAEPLRFYRSLTAREKKTLQTDGLMYSALRDRAQRRLFGEMLQAANAHLTDPTQQEVRLRLSIDQGWSRFALESATERGESLGEWRVRALPAADIPPIY